MKEKILHLTLMFPPFEVMVTGEKPYEIRVIKDRIKSLLLTKDGECKEFDKVKFVNGYGGHRPSFMAEFQSVEIVCAMDKTFSNGLTIKFDTPHIMIMLGKVTDIRNYKIR